MEAFRPQALGALPAFDVISQMFEVGFGTIGDCAPIAFFGRLRLSGGRKEV
jgi:hypothetical protein